MDIVADALNTLKTHEIAGQRHCTVKASKLIAKILDILKSEGYISSYKTVEDGRGSKIEVELSGKINEARVIKPRMPVKKGEWPTVETRFLPAYNIGVIIISTSKGVITNVQAQDLGVGGRLIAYVY
ncbi:MAG: 30S ribosomal protein S8 [Candidatus ainarchaeum sp.]|nr:30S ribosomal protein S8 [Candidatus ainarchaeum sp.]